MLLSHFKRLCITSVTLIAASPLATVVSRPTSLPNTLQEQVPSCAQSCLQNSLTSKFPVACTGQEGIQCLCSHYNSNGESLGEAALGCVYSSCPNMDRSAVQAYNVCLGQKDAVLPTKTALTVVASSTARTTSTPSSTKPIITPTISTTLRTQISSTQSIFVDSVSFTPSATPSPSSTFAAAPVAADDTPKMTPAQIAGLSVAAVAAFVIAVGLMALSVCLRRRRDRKSPSSSDEKGMSPKSKKYSTRVSRYVPVGSSSEPPSRFPLPPPKAALKNSKASNIGQAKPNGQPFPTRPVQRNGVGTSNSSSNTSLPLDQIGVAISAELDGTPAVIRPPVQAPAQPQQAKREQRPDAAFRPVSTMTQDTVFEEDEPASRRRSSVLLPTPPVPIPPIRQLQPSRAAPVNPAAPGFPVPPSGNRQQSARRSELFLDIPIRHERPQPQRIEAPYVASNGSPKPVRNIDNTRLAPPLRMNTATSSPQKTPASSLGPGNTGDIDEYYFTSRQEITPRASPAQFTRMRDSPKTVQIRSKASRSTVSRASSQASTNIRDSVSSQTSFETADPSDPTPDDEDDDKQLSDENKLSPVAESPISNLRYPKVPRASNQLVPRSPRSGQQTFNTPRSLKSQPSMKRTQPSPRRAPSPSVILQHRHKDLAPLLLETRLPLKLHAPRDPPQPQPQREPLKDPFTSPPRARAHLRSNSTESWSTTPPSHVDRKSRTQSGMWPASPAMHDFDAVKPLNVRKDPIAVRRKRDEMKELNIGRDVEHDAEGLRSPLWIPKLTPTRRGGEDGDLFISVGWGDGRM